MNAARGSTNASAPEIKCAETIQRQTGTHMRNICLTLAIFAACSVSSGCAVMAVGAAAGVGMAAVQDRTAGEVMDDGHVYSDIKARLLAADSTGFRDTHV